MSSEFIERAGSLVREHVDTSLGSARRTRERARLIEAATRPPSSRARLYALAAALALVAIVVVVTLRHNRGAESALTFDVGRNAEIGRLGVYYAAPGESELALRFSDKSTVTLAPAGGARVSHTEAHGATLLLEGGSARVDVAHHRGSEWHVAAGPYDVRVTGTSFVVSWDAGSARFELQMRSGVVVVRGPGVESGVEVRGTERFVSHASARVERGPVSAPSSAVAETEILHSYREGAPESASAQPTTPTKPESAAPSSFTALAKKGDYRRIVAEADQRGIEAALESTSAGDLAALADAARYTGRTDLARRAFTTLRRRFPHSAASASAAFVLGRMQDEGGDLSGARSWYDSYLAEAPGGPLAAEALGRRMLVLRRLGDEAGSRSAAERYLKQFPNGPYAHVARELIDN